MNYQTPLTATFDAFPDAAHNGSANVSTADVLQARFARRITSALSERSREVSPDIGERLKFAREQALQRARRARPATVAVPEWAFAGIGTGATGRRRPSGAGWGLRFGSVLPLIALVAGLVFIQHSETNSQIAAAAEIDTALLADDVPPDAYGDPGFIEFLKGPSN